MYDLKDTIVAISSPPVGARTIIRITGADTVNICKELFDSPIAQKTNGIIKGQIAIDPGLRIDARLYLFFAPHSYTGDDVAEIHLHTNRAVTTALMAGLFHRGLRMAGPGEFTARAYLAGKIDLAQAEAVNEIITTSNTFQLAAAEKLLTGQLAQKTEKIQSAIIDYLSLIEAGLDFSEENIEFIARDETIDRLAAIKSELGQLLAGTIRYESLLDLPAVGIAGAPNAGKSSLLNALLGKERSIVSHECKTTRDVLTGILTLKHSQCVLFDCAGLVAEAENILDDLAQQAATAALCNSSLVLFCVDLSKEDWSEDVSIYSLIEPGTLLAVATKSDLLSEVSAERDGSRHLGRNLARLSDLFGFEFLPVSVKTGDGIESLRNAINTKIVQLMGLAIPFGTSGSAPEQADLPFSETDQSAVAITVRHRQAVTEAIENIDTAIKELNAGNNEVAAIMLRAAYQAISDIEQQPVDEQILEKIFSRFCIGK
jgi:tRNA modification GTPase